MIAADRYPHEFQPGAQPLSDTSSKLAYLRPHTPESIDLGQRLLHAGLVTELQLAAALRHFQKARHLQLGEILVSQGAIAPQTVDFFVRQLPVLERERPLLTIGQILTAAGLLSKRQVKAILNYQRRHPDQRFGEIAIAFGWVKLQPLTYLLTRLYPKCCTAVRSPHPSVGNGIKRFIDILGAAIGLSLTVAALIPVAIAIRLNSKGPIFYSQIRYGLRGKPFRIWKFRSMVAWADRQQHLVENEAEGQFFKQANDARITRVGRFLRRTSLDEFPQFWNVLMGDMSLVGTRPPTPNEVQNYGDWHWQRLDVKPGLTGEWQANGRSNIKSFDDVVRLDLAYQARWSIVYDLKLIWKTIYVVLACKGAC
ncbi:sugar transferase [Synechococcus sp. PCC 7336]|uniref:sugar transferase n=1 Tax=Synechococcus sp. PCC 7336 TaxID=195250 RepID=UPI00037C7EA0|nr:sugar transferase [Synechococcus sp. PCC 7336]